MRSNFSVLIARYVFLMLGFAVMAYAIGLVVRANLGLDSWSVLHMGLTHHVPITLGRASQIVGLLAILVSWLLGIRPTLATVMNMYFVGAFYDYFDQHHWLPAPSSHDARGYAYLTLGALLLALGAAWYMSANLGQGPRDSLMVGLVDRMGWRVRTVRWGIEGSAIVLGFLLGGPVGIGTVVNTLLGGQVLELWLKVFRRLEEQPWSYGVIRVPMRRAVPPTRMGSESQAAAS